MKPGLVQILRSNVEYTVINNNVQALDWFIKQGYPIDHNILKLMAKHGHLDMLTKYFDLTVRPNLRQKLAKIAAQNNHIHILTWLYSRDLANELILEPLFKIAIDTSSQELLTWLCQKYLKLE